MFGHYEKRTGISWHGMNKFHKGLSKSNVHFVAKNMVQTLAWKDNGNIL